VVIFIIKDIKEKRSLLFYAYKLKSLHKSALYQITENKKITRQGIRAYPCCRRGMKDN